VVVFYIFAPSKCLLKLQFQILEKILFLSIVCLLLSCNHSLAPQKGISGEEAIAQAEQFIVQQGYTDLPPQINQLKFEKGEFASDTSKIISYRKNTLEKKAFATKQHGGSWTVGFMYINKENNIGRAVTMDTLGVNTIMQAQEVRLDWFYEED